MSTRYLVTPDILASRGKRFINYVVDTIVVVIIFFLCFMGFLIVADNVNTADNILDTLDTMNPLTIRIVMAGILALIYFTLEFLTKGRSIGKYITKTKVVMEDGSLPTAGDYLKRSFSRMIPLEQFSFLGAGDRGWHDTISKTFVVDIEMFEAKKQSANDLDLIGAGPVEQ